MTWLTTMAPSQVGSGNAGAGREGGNGGTQPFLSSIGGEACLSVHGGWLQLPACRRSSCWCSCGGTCSKRSGHDDDREADGWEGAWQVPCCPPPARFCQLSSLFTCTETSSTHGCGAGDLRGFASPHGPLPSPVPTSGSQVGQDGCHLVASEHSSDQVAAVARKLTSTKIQVKKEGAQAGAGKLGKLGEGCMCRPWRLTPEGGA